MSKELTEFESDPYSLFIFGFNSPLTKEKCVPRLNKFFEYIHLKGNMQEKCWIFAQNAKDEPSWALNRVIKYLQMNKDRVGRKEITAATLHNNVKVVKLFCEMNDILLPWRRITRGMPKARRYADDRAPTLEEIRKIIDYPDRRIKAIVTTMVSSGIRLGAWNYLKWKHITPIEKEGKIVAAKIVVYQGDPEQYFSFITPEALFELEKWMACRKESDRFKKFDIAVIKKRNYNLDIFWLVNNSYLNYVDLPKPELIASNISQKLGVALDSINQLVLELNKKEKGTSND